MRILFLDDNPKRQKAFLREYCIGKEVVFVQHVKDLISQVCSFSFDEIWLDHDLDGRTFVPEHEENTGSEAVRFFMKNPKILDKTPVVYVHSHNEEASLSMISKLALVIKKANLSTQVFYHPFSFAEKD